MAKFLFSIALLSLLNAYAAKLSANINSTQSIATHLVAVDLEYMDPSIYYAGCKFSFIPITESEYNKQKKEFYPKDSLTKIADVDKVKDMLKDIVVWKETPEEGIFPVKINTRDGRTIYQINAENDYFDSYLFTAYFPTEDVILFEGGHSSEWAYNLTTGEEIEITGNPEMSFTSHNKQFKVMGLYNGQMSEYYIQKKTKDSYINLFGLEDSRLEGSYLEYIIEGFWDNKTTFYFICPENGDDERKVYYKMTIDNYTRKSLPSENFLIRNNGAGDFVINSNIENMINQYDAKLNIIYREEGIQEPIWKIYPLGISILAEYKDETSETDDKIAHEIYVKSDRFCTEKLIGTNSTVGDFLKAYPDATLVYSYIAQSFWLDTPLLPHVQFRIDKNGLRNHTIDLMAGDSVRLNFSDFDPDTHIYEIRIY